jgi:hypothetical protein
MKTTVATAAGAAILAAAMAWAQPPTPSPACAEARVYRFLRAEEDWGFLRDPACRVDALDGLKYIALDPTAERFVTLGGDARIRLDNGHNVVFADSPGNTTNVLLYRLHLHANLRLDSALRVFTELKASDVHGRVPLVTDVNRLDIQQAFADIGDAAGTALRVGRQELLYGSGRRIFPRYGPNDRGTFDAVRLITRHAGWKADLFAFRPVEIDPGTFDDSAIRTQKFMGVYATGMFAALAPFTSDLYYIRADRERARFNQGSGNELRHSAGARLAGRGGDWDFDGEVTAQWGRFGAGSISAWALALECGHSFPDVALRPRIGMRFDAASGDRDPANADLQTFNSLFPRGGVVAEGFNMSPANVIHARPSLDLNYSPALRLLLAADAAWRTSGRDGVYGPGGNLIVPASQSHASYIGYDTEARAIWYLSRHSTLDLAAAYFVAGRYLRDVGIVKDQVFVSLVFLYRF